jgi:dTDP-4-dehydrorhamnose reductase
MIVGVLGNGFVGTTVINHLRTTDYTVLTFNRDTASSIQLDYLINCAGTSKKFEANSSPIEDTKKTISLIEKIKSIKYNRLIHVSSIDAMICADVYGANKRLIEACLEKDTTTIIRLGGLIGKGLKKNIIYDMINGDKIFVTPYSVYNFINIAVLPKIILKYIETNQTCNLFNFASTKNVSVSEICKLFNKTPDFGTRTDIYPEIDTSFIQNMHQIKTSEEYIKEFIDDNSNS